ncbi:MAG: GspH/FimT family pseudopilin, partial [Steroidobacteraceae bacterium]
MPRQGFSLPELLVALAIGGILLALAVPSLARQRATSAVGAAANQTLAALHLARRLALARGQTITVCPSDDGASCRFG